jgi:hypothetical protein
MGYSNDLRVRVIRVVEGGVRTGSSERLFAALYANGAPFRIKLRTFMLLKSLYNFRDRFL